MLSTLIFTVAALAAMVVAVAAHRRPLVCCPAAGVAAGILLPLGLELAVAGDQAVALAASTTGLVAGGWGLTVAARDFQRRRAAAERAERERAACPEITPNRAELDGAGHTITVERMTRGAARGWIYVVGEDWPSLIGRRAVVERHDGRLVKVCAIEGVDGVTGEEIRAAARGTARTYGARYVPVTARLGSSESARHDLAVDNIAGGAR